MKASPGPDLPMEFSFHYSEDNPFADADFMGYLTNPQLPKVLLVEESGNFFIFSFAVAVIPAGQQPEMESQPQPETLSPEMEFQIVGM